MNGATAQPDNGVAGPDQAILMHLVCIPVA